MKLVSNLFPASLSKSLRFEKVPSCGAYVIYFKPSKYEGEVEEFIGYIDDLPTGYVHLYILAEHYSDDGLRPDIKSELEKILSSVPFVRNYVINSDDTKLIKHVRNL